MVPKAHTLYMPDSTPDIPVNKVLWSHSKKFFDKMAKNIKCPNFDPLLIIKKSIENIISTK